MNSHYPVWPRQGSAGIYIPAEDISQVIPRGYSMATSGRNNSNVSNLSMSSATTLNSLSPSPVTPSFHEPGSPTEIGGCSPYHTPLANNIEAPPDYFQASPIRHQPKNMKSTPSSLGWTLALHWLQLYKFVVKQKGKERYFELLPEAKVTRDTPHRVDLDQDMNPVKGVHRCMYPGGCRGKKDSFSRPADLDRHYQNVHAGADMKTKFLCNYRKCGRRANDPFTRKDHYRDHLKDFHKEDIGCAKGEHSKNKPKDLWEREQAQWLRERVIYSHYWRCSKCLDKVTVAKSGWECPRCNTACEAERVEARRKLAPKAEILDTMDEDTIYNPLKAEILDTMDEDTIYNPLKAEILDAMDDDTMASFSSCVTCSGTSYIDGGFGAWIVCPVCQAPPQHFYSDNFYPHGR